MALSSVTHRDSPMRIDTSYPRSISRTASPIFSRPTRTLPKAASSWASFVSTFAPAGVAGSGPRGPSRARIDATSCWEKLSSDGRGTVVSVDGAGRDSEDAGAEAVAAVMMLIADASSEFCVVSSK